MCNLVNEYYLHLTEQIFVYYGTVLAYKMVLTTCGLVLSTKLGNSFFSKINNPYFTK